MLERFTRLSSRLWLGFLFCSALLTAGPDPTLKIQASLHSSGSKTAPALPYDGPYVQWQGTEATLYQRHDKEWRVEKRTGADKKLPAIQERYGPNDEVYRWIRKIPKKCYVKHIVVGHSTQKTIEVYHQDILIALDAGMRTSRQGEVLIYENQQLFKGKADGTRESLTPGPPLRN